MPASYDPDSEYFLRPQRKPVRKHHSLYANAAALAYPAASIDEDYLETTSAHHYGGNEMMGQRPIDHQIVEAKQQLHLLREEQKELYRQRLVLEERHAKDARFEQKSALLINQLSQAVMEFQERAQTARAEAQALQQAADSFRLHLQSLNQIRPESWRSHGHFKELDRALAILEEGETVLQRGQRSLQQMVRKSARFYGAESHLEHPRQKRGFFFWLRCGFAFSLPLAAVLTVAVILILTALQGAGL